MPSPPIDPSLIKGRPGGGVVGISPLHPYSAIRIFDYRASWDLSTSETTIDIAWLGDEGDPDGLFHTSRFIGRSMGCDLRG